MKTIDDIKSILTSPKRELLEKYGVTEIGVFGSYVRGGQKSKVTSMFWVNSKNLRL